MLNRAATASSLRICIADADPARRSLFRSIAASVGDCTIVAECADGFEAMSAIRELQPDIVVADAGLARIDGLRLLRESGAGQGTAFVLTTSELADAATAFTESAVDCIVRPLEAARCRLALDRARQHVARLSAATLGRQLSALLDRCGGMSAAPSSASYLSRIIVSAGRRPVAVPTDAVEWIAAEDCYSRIYVDGASHVIRQTLGTLERQLDPAFFIRPHRSAMVNVDGVVGSERLDGGGVVLLLRSGAKVPVSQRKRSVVSARLDERLGRHWGAEELEPELR